MKNIILLSGGSGKRLWPLSNDIRSKQFIRIFKKPEHSIPMGTEYTGDYESMIQRVYRQIKTIDPETKVTIATNKAQVSAIHNQLGTSVGISPEPRAKGTFPAIALAAARLREEQNVPDDEAVVVCPVDPYVDDSYFQCLESLHEKNTAISSRPPTTESITTSALLKNRTRKKRNSILSRVPSGTAVFSPSSSDIFLKNQGNSWEQTIPQPC